MALPLINLIKGLRDQKAFNVIDILTKNSVYGKKHFSHDHELVPRSEHLGGFNCSICSGPIPKDDTAYFCSWSCYHVIHEKCVRLPQHINAHSLHNHDHSLTLSPKSFSQNISSSNCYYCDQPFSSGEYYTYSCQQCPDFHMHATCGAVPLPTPITSDHGDDDAIVVRFACHQHPMITNLDHEANKVLLCFACRLPGSSPDQEAYSCISKECENFFHRSCSDRLRQRISHPSHHHSLLLQVSKPRSCDSCCRKDCRLIYTCRESIGNCSFELCTQCANYSTIVQCQSHDHPLSLVEKMAHYSCDAIQCDACQKSYKKLFDFDAVIPEEVVQTRPLMFRCLEMECSFNLHLLCGPLPVRVKYEYHIHPLNLVNHEITEEDLDEYYCDACEQLRDTRFRVYHCASCKFIAHIHCVLPKIMNTIKGDTRDVELMAMGEDRWDFGLKLKQLSDDSTKDLTMRDMVESLTQKEKLILIDPLDFNTPFKNVTIGRYHYFRQLNSNRFDLSGFMENIDGVQQLFNFDSTAFYHFTCEVNNFVTLEGFKLDEKYLRQEVDDVKGYKVPKTVAPILRALLHKYESLGENSGLTTSFTATLLCVVIDKMCRTKVEDITRDNIRHWRFCLRGVQCITGSYIISRYLDLLENLAMQAFLGNEAIRCEQELRESLTHKIETLEAELKKCKDNCQKLEAYASKKSDLMKKCLRKASKSKGKYFLEKLL